LATQIGSHLVGVMYVLDEPSIGLHQRDNERLLRTLEHLRDIGNSVIVVEHDLDTIWAADHLVDFGPGAGLRGGRIVGQGTPEEVAQTPGSLTGDYLAERRRIEVPAERRKPHFGPPGKGGERKREWIEVLGAEANNLRGIDVRIPVGVFTCVSGVSGAGKSSLVNQILIPAIRGEAAGKHRAIKGLQAIDKMIQIDQQPIGRTPRSNPATYTKLFDSIRDFFAELPQSKMYGYAPGRFSFNVKGGRCETCQGDGSLKIEMHFLADVYVTCEDCKGRRFNEATLQVKYKGKSIADVLDLSVAEAAEVFADFPSIKRTLDTLIDVGLDYIHLGQSAPTLSGGEAQRIKLSRELCKRSTGRTLYILDEPSTGLHLDDVQKLLAVLQRLVDAGNTVVVIEHNLDIIKVADWIIDIGPEGGKAGGDLVAEGTPEEVARVARSHTGRWLGPLLAAAKAPQRTVAGARS
ncbi:MAG TPA: excinuclease ABC subunit UvrA, partial [Planctomycetota bacterium]|nr:excinuclease ABC subunit UvrA [Planctomycetota bacterium]